MATELLGPVTSLADGNETQLVHKEWPETAPRRGRGRTVERRGLFDIAVLSPGQVRRASLEQFRQGRIAPPIVVELGLDYGADHLRGDVKKFENSQVLHGRLVHLTRLPPRRDGVESVMNGLSGATSVRGAYGYHDLRGAKAVKLLGDAAIRDA